MKLDISGISVEVDNNLERRAEGAPDELIITGKVAAYFENKRLLWQMTHALPVRPDPMIAHVRTQTVFSFSFVDGEVDLPLVGGVVWFESAEPGLTRPSWRMRFVLDQIEADGRYKHVMARHAPPEPAEGDQWEAVPADFGELARRLAQHPGLFNDDMRR